MRLRLRFSEGVEQNGNGKATHGNAQTYNGSFRCPERAAQALGLRLY